MLLEASLCELSFFIKDFKGIGYLYSDRPLPRKIGLVYKPNEQDCYYILFPENAEYITYDLKYITNFRYDNEFKNGLKGLKTHRLKSLDSKYLLDAGIKNTNITLTDKSMFKTILDYTENLAKGVEINVEYRFMDLETPYIIIDHTDRTLSEKILQGYRGNRLDLMLQPYTVAVNFTGYTFRVCKHYQGKLYTAFGMNIPYPTQEKLSQDNTQWIKRYLLAANKNYNMLIFERIYEL
jgi:hypothetical protein